ncbi:hypothetical protein D1831_10440 [Lactiplantibacillus garii]|uniref:Uncharacterized protein n=1 Tax=Lactiplantibacillus garii TaxID=2306423 RepID=A0A3R8KKI3_9LACO|nr:hypothetical protein [Lactiplantibacillus garii]RRK09837.1 hypothetical protein D1831_10440 [Lactiplantibacillus garii]
MRRKQPRYLGLLIIIIGLSILALSWLFIGYDNSDASTGNHRLFKTELHHVTVTDRGEWRVSGTTDAPAGSKIVALGTTDVASVASSLASTTDWARVNNGRFTATINAYNAIDGHDYHNGQRVPVTVVAVTDYQQRQYDLLPAGLRDQLQQFAPHQLKLTEQLAQYCRDAYHQYD